MEDKVNKIDRDLSDLKRDFDRFRGDFDRLSQKIDEIHREMGARDGRDLHQQINEFETKLAEFENYLQQATRDAQATRKLTEYGDVQLKEIMKALALIYKNTDELEDNLIEAENIHTT